MFLKINDIWHINNLIDFTLRRHSDSFETQFNPSPSGISPRDKWSKRIAWCEQRVYHSCTGESCYHVRTLIESMNGFWNEVLYKRFSCFFLACQSCFFPFIYRVIKAQICISRSIILSFTLFTHTHTHTHTPIYMKICLSILTQTIAHKIHRESAGDIKRSLELAAYFTHCNLQPAHLMLALKTAMALAFKNKVSILHMIFYRFAYHC